MPGRASRQKGYRFEHAVVLQARARGRSCRRIPLSGAAPGWAGDLLLEGRVFEAKCVGRGFRRLYRWLEGRDGLILGADRRPALAVIRLADYLELAPRSKRPTAPFAPDPANCSNDPDGGDRR